MGIINRLFQKQINDAVQQNIQVIFKGEAQYRRLVYGNQLYNGMIFKPGEDTSIYVANGYEANPDAFSIITRLAVMGGQVEWKVYKRIKGKLELEENIDHPLYSFISQPNGWQSWSEYYVASRIYFYTTGNAIIYYPTFKDGNSRGQLMSNIGAFILPSQYVNIESGGPLKPIANYTIDYNILNENKLPVEDVIHLRYPSLDTMNASNLMGMSPLKVAANIIKAQNAGTSQMANLYDKGMPPGFVTREDLPPGEVASNESITAFEKQWKKKAKKQEPLYGWGKHSYTKLGFDTIRDMEIIEGAQHGLRVLCNVFQVPSIMFNDVNGSTFSNRKEAREEMWINRIKPDDCLMAEKHNQKIKIAYPGYEIWPDYSNIPELQKNKAEQVNNALAGFREGVLTGNEVRKMGYEIEEADEESMNMRFLPMGRTPIDQVISDSNLGDQILDNQGITHYLNPNDQSRAVAGDRT